MIPSRCILMATNEGDVVLDPFGGGGSTYEAAQRLKRYWLGTEIVTAAAVRARFKRQFPSVKSWLPRSLARAFVDAEPLFRIRIH